MNEYISESQASYGNTEAGAHTMSTAKNDYEYRYEYDYEYTEASCSISEGCQQYGSNEWKVTPAKVVNGTEATVGKLIRKQQHD